MIDQIKAKLLELDNIEESQIVIHQFNGILEINIHQPESEQNYIFQLRKHLDEVETVWSSYQNSDLTVEQFYFALTDIVNDPTIYYDYDTTHTSASKLMERIRG